MNQKLRNKIPRLENKFEEISIYIEETENKIFEYEQNGKDTSFLEDRKDALETRQYEIQLDIDSLK
jgi:hypothetical protein